MSKERNNSSNENNIKKRDLVVIPSSNVTKLKLIGSGGFAEVYSGKWEGQDVAIKQLHLKQLAPSLYDDFLNEAEILARCRHPAIVHFFGICTQENSYQIILEYLHRGSLYDNLSNPNINISMNPMRLEISLDIARGLRYLHQLDIIHKDLKSMNVLLSNDWKAKITDFGLAKIKVATEISSTLTKKAASIRWCSPELFKRNGVRTKHSDVWSFGMILWEIVTRKVPYGEEPNEMIVMGFIKDGEKENIPSDCPSFLSEIISKCWEIDPQKRIESAQIVELLEPKVAEALKEIKSSKNEVENLQKGIQNIKLRMADKEIEEVKTEGISDRDIRDYVPEKLVFVKSYEDGIISKGGKVVNGKGGNVYTDKSFSSGKHRWMIRVFDRKTAVTLGVVNPEAKDSYVGMDANGWGIKIFSYSISAYHKGQYNDEYLKSTAYKDGDTFGILLDCDEGKLSFLRNGKFLGVAHTKIPKVKLIPAVTLYSAGVEIVDWE